MNQSRSRHLAWQAKLVHTQLRTCCAVVAIGLSLACADHGGIVGPVPPPKDGTSYPGFDTSIYPGDAAMSAWLKPASPYGWVGYYLEAPCHRDPSWMGKRATLTGMGWGLAVLYVGQQTFDGLPFLDLRPPRSNVARPSARAGIMTPATAAEIESSAVTCSRTLLTTEQGTTDAIDAVTKTASEGFPNASVIYLDIEPMQTIPSSMDAYYRAWVQQVLADGRFRPGIYVSKSNAQAIYEGVARAYADMHVTGTAVFWVSSTSGFSLNKSPTDVGLPFARVWQGILDVSQSWSGVSINIDVDVAAMPSPSGP
jgi:glycoside hydrolase-like protein